ncbi:MAG: GTP-binding protein [Promethearchaeota archaeon]
MKKIQTSRLLFKIVFIGFEGVGRRTLLRGFTSYGFNNGESRYETVGAEFYSKRYKIEKYEVELFIWNLNSAEDCNFLRPSFYRETSLAVLAFSIINKNSFIFLNEFLSEIRMFTGNIPIYLVGNMRDLKEFRKVSRETAKKFVKNNNLIDYIEISAKNGLNCEEIFENIARLLYESHKNS